MNDLVPFIAKFFIIDNRYKPTINQIYMMASAWQRLVKQTLILSIVFWLLFIFLSLSIDAPLLNLVKTFNEPAGLITLSHLASEIFSTEVWAGILLVVMFVNLWYYSQYHVVSRRLLSIALSLIFAIGLTLCLKILLGRQRPSFGQGHLSWFRFDDAHHSFPSGHTALTTAGMLGWLWALKRAKQRRWTYLVIFIIFIVAVSRVLVIRHFLSDVIGGIYIGMIAALWAKGCCHWLQQHSRLMP